MNGWMGSSRVKLRRGRTRLRTNNNNGKDELGGRVEECGGIQKCTGGGVGEGVVSE